MVISTIFGICNISARLLTVFAPIIAQFKDPLPMIIFAVLNAICLILVLVQFDLKEKQEPEKKPDFVIIEK